MRREDNYAMMKRATPKRVTLPDCRTFVVRYGRVPRSNLVPHIKIRSTEVHLRDKGVGG